MIAAANDTKQFWENLPANARARTLALDRFVDFPDGGGDKDWRRRTCRAVGNAGHLGGEKLSSWKSFLVSLDSSDEKFPNLVFARLESRLMVNMAGGVLENGGLSLDRTSGVPFIPGSAVKGCARRTALAALREWTDEGAKPAGSHPLARAAEPFASRSEMLAEIAMVFGWGDLEWKDGADFNWACGTDWETVKKESVSLLRSRIGPGHAEPGSKLGSFAGLVAFLPAFPWENDPGIELDVVTCHHPEYYRGDREVATDDESPNPVVFPAVKPGTVWVFALRRSPAAPESAVNAARRWLETGISLFGLGAKTNAGYGWFSLIGENKRNEIVEALADCLPFDAGRYLKRLKSMPVRQLASELKEKLAEDNPEVVLGITRELMGRISTQQDLNDANSALAEIFRSETLKDDSPLAKALLEQLFADDEVSRAYRHKLKRGGNKAKERYKELRELAKEQNIIQQ